MIRNSLGRRILAIGAIIIFSCGQQNTDAGAERVQKEEKVLVHTAAGVADLYLDSTLVNQFLSKHNISEERAEQLQEFYQSRNYSFAWFSDSGLEQQAQSFWNLHNQYLNYSQDSSFFDKHLHQRMQEILDSDDVQLNAEEIREVELELTDHFFDYAKYAYAGKIDPAGIKWHIPRKKINSIRLLDSLIATNGQQLDDWEPLNADYKKLRKEVLRLYEVQRKGGWAEIDADKKSFRKGDSAAPIRQLKIRLLLGGDLTSDDGTNVFTTKLEMAVKKAQNRFGLVADAVIGPATLRELNVPVEKRIEQLLVNMERMRWMPQQRKGKLLLANIPSFRLHVYEGEKEVFNMPIVVGKAANKTVVFSDELKHIVFSPYWNIPRSIVRNEILPAMKRNPNYLANKNMEQVGNNDGLPRIRQKPGPGNALGKVKFLFPNSYAIYFHDTPAKSLFSENKRAFSHGCIRLAEPKKLAEYLLKDNDAWTEDRIVAAMNAGSEKWVTLEEPVPVAITYFTAWVDKEGVLNFRDDIYGHDRTLASRLFE